MRIAPERRLNQRLSSSSSSDERTFRSGCNSSDSCGTHRGPGVSSFSPDGECSSHPVAAAPASTRQRSARWHDVEIRPPPGTLQSCRPPRDPSRTAAPSTASNRSLSTAIRARRLRRPSHRDLPASSIVVFRVRQLDGCYRRSSSAPAGAIPPHAQPVRGRKALPPPLRRAATSARNDLRRSHR